MFGYIFFLIVKIGGVFVRDGYIEVLVDFVRFVGFKEIGFICEIMKDDGIMVRVDDLMIFKEKYNLKIIIIKDFIEYCKINEIIIEKVFSVFFLIKYGNFEIIGYRDIYLNEEYIVFIYGNINIENILVRFYFECLIGDVFYFLKCDCGL